MSEPGAKKHRSEPPAVPADVKDAMAAHSNDAAVLKALGVDFPFDEAALRKWLLPPQK
jgi:hypothetical protein